MGEALWRKSAVELAAGIRNKDFSAREAATSVYERIDELNPTINAIVEQDRDAALAAADEADQQVQTGGDLPPLLGVPTTIKINVDVEGHANSNGIPAFKDIIAPGNAPIVQNLLDAGAVIVGLTNTPEFSMRGTTDNPLHGLTHNPWQQGMSPGGSSGGAGAAAAAGFGAIHHGNDIGGSLRFPSSNCGVTSVKPGFGRVPAFNPSATAERGILAQLMSVQGVICREVADVREGLKAVIKHDPRDPWHVPMPFEQSNLGAPIKVAFTKNAHGYPIHADIQANLERAAKLLDAAGYIVEEVEPPPITEPAHGWFSVAILEIKETLGSVAEQVGSETIQTIFDNFYRMSDMVDYPGYMTGVAERTRMVREWSQFLAEYPLVLTPFLMRPVYPCDYDETYEGLKDLFDSAIYSFGLNYLGFPAGVVPMGLVEGLPSSVQVVGQKFHEDAILDALGVLEADVGVLAETLWDR